MFLQSDYNDLMPPEPENDEASPEKKGLSRFLEIIGDHGGALLAVNLLFLLGCLPVVTIPASLFAMNRVVRRIVLNQPVRCAQVYWETFRQEWKRGDPAFLLTALPIGVSGCGMWFYLGYAASNFLFFLPFLVCSTVFLVTLLSSGCLYGLLDGGRSVKESIRLAVLLGIARPRRTVPAALLSYGLLVLSILFFPISGIYLILLGFSLPCLLGNLYLRTIWKE